MKPATARSTADPTPETFSSGQHASPMNTTVSSELTPDHLLLVGYGEIMSLDQYRFYSRQVSHEIGKFDRRKIILDERQVEYGPSLLLQLDSIDFYDSDLGEDAADWQLCVVAGDDLLMLGEFWAKSSRDAGYAFQFFSSIEEAVAFLESRSEGA